MSDNAQGNDGLATGKTVSGENTSAPKGFRDSSAYNVVLGVLIFAMAVGVFLILKAQHSRPDGPELLRLTERRVQKKVEKYLEDHKVIKAGIAEVPKDLAFKASTLRFTTPNVEEVRQLPEIVEFQMDLATTGDPEGRQGRVTGYFGKDTGEMVLNYNLIYAQDSVPTSFGPWDEE